METRVIMKNHHPKELKSLALAYMGDVIHEKYVREYLIKKGTVKVQHLHQNTTRFVKASAQAKVIHEWLNKEQLTETERSIARRGRNAKSASVPKNTSVQNYRYSTAFEALLGYLYLDSQIERLEELVSAAITFVEEGRDNL